MTSVPMLRPLALLMALCFASPALAQSGQPESRETIGDWVLECFGEETEGEAARCQLYQRVLTQDPTVVAMVVALAWSESENALKAQIALPLGVDLRQLPVLLVDSEGPITLVWNRCLRDGCFVEPTFAVEVVDRLLTAERASLGIIHPQNGPITIPLSLAGFPEALARIRPQAEDS